MLTEEELQALDWYYDWQCAVEVPITAQARDIQPEWKVEPQEEEVWEDTYE